MKNLYKHVLFPTNVYSFFLDIDLDFYIKLLYNYKKDDLGVNVSNVGGWQSSHGLHNDKNFKDLCYSIKKSCFKLWSTNIKILNMWGNISQKHHFNSIHSHGEFTPNQWSGCFYLQTFSSSGAFRIHHRSYPSRHVDLYPKPNEILLFESETYHSVLPNLEDQDRISIAFNLITT